MYVHFTRNRGFYSAFRHVIAVLVGNIGHYGEVSADRCWRTGQRKYELHYMLNIRKQYLIFVEVTEHFNLIYCRCGLLFFPFIFLSSRVRHVVFGYHSLIKQGIISITAYLYKLFMHSAVFSTSDQITYILITRAICKPDICHRKVLMSF